MNPYCAPILLLSAGIIPSCFNHKPETDKEKKKEYCICDSIRTSSIVTSDTFNRMSQYDTTSFDMSIFFENDSINRVLWYRDVENIDTTKFTKHWNDYYPAAYHASHGDFVQYYSGRKNIEMAFQFGPNRDLWAYHIFVIRKIDCCYLITRSYFRHARFTYKAYGIIKEQQLDSLYTILRNINKKPVEALIQYDYLGYFVDNRHKNNFFIDFEEEVIAPKTEPQTRKEIRVLYDFVDKRISWTKTYNL